MKKLLQASLLLFCAVSFMGCPDKPVLETEITSISVRPKNVVLTDNESSIRLSISYTPEDANKPAIIWSSNDTTVATVSSTGYVEATGYGSCYIYAETKNGLKDSCLVEVKSYLESLIFNSAIVWDIDTTYAYDTITHQYIVDTITSFDGDTYYAYKALTHLRVFSDGFYVNNSGSIDGTATGTIIDIFAPMYYATAYLNNSENGTYFVLGEWDVTNNIRYMKQGKPGKITDEAKYVSLMKQFIDGYNANPNGNNGTYLESAAGLIEGSTLTIWEYDEEGEGYRRSFIPDAICDEAQLYLNGNFPASKYMCGLDYSKIKFTPITYSWGMNIQEDENGKLYLEDEDIHYGAQIESSYGDIPAASAQKVYKPLNIRVISEDPELAARLEKQIKERSVVTLKKKF